MAGRTTSSSTHLAVAAAIVIAVISAVGTAEARRGGLCSNTAYPALCEPLVAQYISPRQATHKSIQALEAKTKETITTAARFKEGNQAVTTCYGMLNDALFNLENARKSIRKRNMLAINTFLTAAVSDFGVCVDAFIEAQQVNVVQNAADTLRKMASNSLSLSTLIY